MHLFANSRCVDFTFCVPLGGGEVKSGHMQFVSTEDDKNPNTVSLSLATVNDSFLAQQMSIGTETRNVGCFDVDFRLSASQISLLQHLRPFYDVDDHVRSVLHKYATQQSRVSLRCLDWLVTNFVSIFPPRTNTQPLLPFSRPMDGSRTLPVSEQEMQRRLRDTDDKTAFQHLQRIQASSLHISKAQLRSIPKKAQDPLCNGRRVTQHDGGPGQFSVMGIRQRSPRLRRGKLRRN
jgi:hypothetical protein